MALQGNDLAILTARFGAARFGASRFGFIPCPEDVMGTGADEPGEYIWKETKPPVTSWTLVNEDCVCRNLCTLVLGPITLSDPTPAEEISVTATIPLSGIIGQVGGIAKINWGDGGHEKEVIDTLIEDDLEFSHVYSVPGTYTIRVTIHDERGCTATSTLPVTVGAIAPLSGDFTAVSSGPFSSGNGLLTLTPTITGGSGSYSYAWSAWTEWGGSEGSPAFTSSATIGLWSPLYEATGGNGICAGQAKLIVTDTVTLLTLSIGPKAWDWQCV